MKGGRWKKRPWEGEIGGGEVMAVSRPLIDTFRATSHQRAEKRDGE